MMAVMTGLVLAIVFGPQRGVLARLPTPLDDAAALSASAGLG